MTLAITILGCGSSGGVPRVGGDWGSCDPSEPRNRRRRCSIFVAKAGPVGRTQVLVDTSPDLREQLLGIGIDRLDAILLTHSHADHTHGMDDVRPLVIRAKRRIPIHMGADTSAVVRRTFPYIFETPPGSLYPPLLDECLLYAGQPANLEGPGGILRVVPFTVHHGEIDAFGYRFGDAAYTPDLNDIPDESLPHLQGLDLWIVDALRYKRHPSHLSLDETLSWIERLKPRRAVLTNLHGDMDFGALAARLPPHIRPAYDGMQLEA
jgi:phosphoribosyl 1,2-cyclic phosphate phosphodiesterase